MPAKQDSMLHALIFLPQFGRHKSEAVSLDFLSLKNRIFISSMEFDMKATFV